MNNAEPISVIVIESQALMLAALSTALAADGMQVLAEVADSRRALQSVAKFKPRMVVFSVGNPSLNDLQTISALRREIPGTLILALVNGEFSIQERVALDYGAHRVLSQTASRAELLAAVKDLIQKNLPVRKKPRSRNLKTKLKGVHPAQINPTKTISKRV